METSEFLKLRINKSIRAQIKKLAEAQNLNESAIIRQAINEMYLQQLQLTE